MTATTDSTLNRLGDEASEAGRDLWRAGLGALTEIKSESKKTFDQLVERGEEFDRERLRPFERRVAGRVEAWRGDLRQRVAGAVTGTLERFGVPTRRDFETLSERLEALSKRIDELAAR